MSQKIITEDALEQITLAWLESLDYTILNGLDIAPDGPTPERINYNDPFIPDRLRNALYKINIGMSSEAIEEAYRKIIIPQSPDLLTNNKTFHSYLTKGITVECRNNEDQICNEIIWPIDFNNIENNDFLAVNQYTMIEGKHNRRPDIVIFINGLPLAIIELKNPAKEDADIHKAFSQFQTYKKQIPSIFTYNKLCIVSDGLYARAGSLTANLERYMPWRTIDGVEIIPKGMPALEGMIKGIFNKNVFLDLIRSFVVFEIDEEEIIKKIAAYHQYYAVNKAVENTIDASGINGDKRAGVIWHTQGSGKSLSMVFYTGKLVKRQEMENPTILVLTDRNDLDNQLFETFSKSSDLIAQTPKQAENKEIVKELLNVASGGIIFSTIQKFSPDTPDGHYEKISDRRNVVVIVDEAHRSQYDFIDGYARHIRDALPNASFIGFTGTPLALVGRNTQAVFGDYIDTYDIIRSVEDGATVKIYYECRLAKIDLDEAEKPTLDGEYEEITEDLEFTEKAKLKTKWAKLEAMVGTEKRLSLVAKDIVDHFEKREAAMAGKGMIVCMSRRICVDLYDQIIKLRPEWHDEEDEKGCIKVIMTGSASDPLNYQPHIRSKSRQEVIKKRVQKKPEDPLKLVIVRDMWLTGFDAPCLHTMYIDKPMGGHNLMQAIARVNRVFKDKEGGLIVDYLGIAEDLKRALSNYTSGTEKLAGVNIDEAAALMLEKYEIVKDIMHGFNYMEYVAKDINTQMSGSILAMEHIFDIEGGKEHYLTAATEFSKAFALAVPHDETVKVRDELQFFQLVKANIVKYAPATKTKTISDYDTAIKQLVSRAITSDKVIDIFSAAGLDKPDISILSNEFLEEVQNLPHKNFALELLHKLLNDQLKTSFKRNVVQERKFSELLEKTIRKYQNRTIEAAKIIAELIDLAKEMREATERGDKINLANDELAFYDALADNESSAILGDETLKAIARELVTAIRNSACIDWNVRESVKAKMRITVKRLLRKYNYPPDKQESATQLVLQQAEVIYPEYIDTPNEE